MNMNFERKLPIPMEVKEHYPVTADIQALVEKRAVEINICDGIDAVEHEIGVCITGRSRIKGCAIPEVAVFVLLEVPRIGPEKGIGSKICCVHVQLEIAGDAGGNGRVRCALQLCHGVRIKAGALDALMLGKRQLPYAVQAQSTLFHGCAPFKLSIFLL